MRLSRMEKVKNRDVLTLIGAHKGKLMVKQNNFSTKPAPFV